MASSIVFKILRRDEWAEFERMNVYYGSTKDQDDGFIHLSTVHQLKATASKYFAGESDIGLLLINADKLGDDLQWEPARDGELFPHLYGELTRKSILVKIAPPLSKKKIKSIVENYKSLLK